MKVKEIMRRQTVRVSPSTSILEVARRMRDIGQEAVAVCDDEGFLGLVWDHDIVCSVVASCSGAGRTRARSVLRRLDVYVSPDSEIMQAAMLMAENNLRILPVLDKGRLVGLLSLEDMAEASEVFAGAILAATARAQSLAQPA